MEYNTPDHTMLVNKCIENAITLFKEEEGEFYPFGYVMNASHQASPYYVRIKEDFPNVHDVLKQIGTSLIKDVANKGRYSQGAVCALATKKVDDVVFEFLNIKTLNDQGEAKDYDVIIDADYKNYTFKTMEIIEGTGTIFAFNLV